MSQENQQEMEKKMKDELLSQLHEQYAVNNNANVSSMVTLIVGIIVVIGYYGYVFVNSCNEFGNEMWQFKCYDSYTLTTLLLTYFATVCVIGILMRLCIYQGIAQRKEQFIIEQIRKYYDTDNVISKILPEDYTAHNKTLGNVTQGLFGEFIKILQWIFLILTLLTGFRVFVSLVPVHCVRCQNFMLSVISIVGACVIMGACYCYLHKQFSRYQKRAGDYSEQKNKPLN